LESGGDKCLFIPEGRTRLADEVDANRTWRAVRVVTEALHRIA
jgi:hypothetical protein